MYFVNPEISKYKDADIEHKYNKPSLCRSYSPVIYMKIDVKKKEAASSTILKFKILSFLSGSIAVFSLFKRNAHARLYV